MFKVSLICALIVCGSAQLAIPKRNVLAQNLVQYAQLPGSPISLLESPVAVQEEAFAVAPARFAISQPVGQIQLQSVQQVSAPILNPITAIRTQEVLPIQELGASAGPQFIQVRNERQQPVVVHFQTQSDPIQIETSHIPSQRGEVSFTQTQDEPHRVVHEVIRPVIQEIREIIQPYRRVTQEIRPVEEQVHTDVTTNAGAPAPVVVEKAVVAAPAVVSAPAQAVVAAPAPIQTLVQNPIQYTYAVPQQQLSNQWLRSNYGVIQAPSPIFTGSYIQQFIENMRSRQPVVVSQPKVTVAAPAVASVTYADDIEPIPSESQNVVPNKVGIVHFSRKHV